MNVVFNKNQLDELHQRNEREKNIKWTTKRNEFIYHVE